MKKGFLFTTALAMALGVGVAVGAHQSQRVEKAEAATETKIFCAISSETIGTKTMKANVNRKGDGDDWATYVMTDTGHTYGDSLKVYKAEFQDLYDGLGVLQFQLYNGDTWADQDEVFSSWTPASTYNEKLRVYKGEGWETYDDPDVDPETPLSPGDLLPDYQLVGNALEVGWVETANEDYQFITQDTNPVTYTWEGHIGMGLFRVIKPGTWVTKLGFTAIADDLDGTFVAGEQDNNIECTVSGTYRVTINAAKDELSFTLLQPDPDVEYVVTINGHEYELVEQAKGDFDAQFKADIAKADVVAGASISFTADDVALSASGDGSDSNNVFVPTGKVLETSKSETVDALWLKKDGENWSYWLGGRTSTYFLVNGSNIVPLAENQEHEGEYFATNLSLAEDSTVKLYAYGATTYNGTVKEGSEGAAVSEGVITMTATGTFNVYYEPSNSNGIYFQQLHTYTVEFGASGSESLQEVAKGDYDAQFKASITVVAGDILSFKRDGSLLTVAEDATNQHNVFVPTHEVIKGGTVDVYLKLKNGNWSYYLAGRDAQYYLYSGESLTALLANPNNPDEVYATNVALTKDDMVQIYETSVTDPELNSYSDDVVEVSEGHITVKTTGSYNVYYNFSVGSLYVGNLSDADRAANEYADLFLEMLSTGENHVCQADGNTDREELDEAWAALKLAFQNIAEDDKVKADAQGILKDANSEADTKVGHFAKLYDTIIKKYHTTAYEDFALRFGGEYDPQVLAKVSNVESGSTAVIIIAVATASALACGMLFIFKKKKQK